MKACIISGALLMSMTVGQVGPHPSPNLNMMPLPEAKAHPSIEDANQVHPLIGRPDGHDGNMANMPPPPPPMNFGKPCMKGRHHRGHKGGHRGHRRPEERTQAKPTGTEFNGQQPQNTDFRVEIQGNQNTQSTGVYVFSDQGYDGSISMTNTEPYPGQLQNDYQYEHPHEGWGGILFPILIFLIAFKLIKCCIKKRRRCQRRRMQQMQQMQMQQQAIVPVPRSLEQQLAYHRHEAQRIEMQLSQQQQYHQQMMHQMQPPMFEQTREVIYGQPINRY